MRMLRDRRALEQTLANLLVLFLSLSVAATALTVITPILDQYNSRNKIREAEAIMAALYDEILKVQEEPIGSMRTLEVEIEEGGIDLLNNPSRMLYYIEVSDDVPMEVEGMDFAHTGRGAMLRINLTATFLKNSFIGPGSNLIQVSKAQNGRINVTTVVFE
jgi:hypothetical protein